MHGNNSKSFAVETMGDDLWCFTRMPEGDVHVLLVDVDGDVSVSRMSVQMAADTLEALKMSGAAIAIPDSVKRALLVEEVANQRRLVDRQTFLRQRRLVDRQTFLRLTGRG